MKKETLEFIGKNIEEVLKFEEILEEQNKERNEKVKRLESKIGKNNNSGNGCNIEYRIWRKYIFVTDIHYSNPPKTIALNIELAGWDFSRILTIFQNSPSKISLLPRKIGFLSLASANCLKCKS